jgi:tRNA(Arg) A34 adenosine deaminase TadA
MAEGMRAAIEEAGRAGERGEVPIGAAVVLNGAVIARAGNQTIALSDPTAHAEMLAIQEAGRKLGSQRMADTDLYVTLEPCTMCAAAISFARVRRLYFGASDEKGGAVENGVRFFSQPSCNHAPEVYGGMAASEAAAILRRFFALRRA